MNTVSHFCFFQVHYKAEVENSFTNRTGNQQLRFVAYILSSNEKKIQFIDGQHYSFSFVYNNIEK